MRNLVTSVALAMVLAGCAAQQLAYVRTDGQRIKTDPVMEQQFQIDAAICNGEMQKANVSGVTFTGGGIAGAVAAANRSNAVGQVAQGCMAQKGYVVVKQEEADAKIAQFAAINEEKKRREQADAAAAVAKLNLPQKKKLSASVQSKPN